MVPAITIACCLIFWWKCWQGTASHKMRICLTFWTQRHKKDYFLFNCGIFIKLGKYQILQCLKFIIWYKKIEVGLKLFFIFSLEMVVGVPLKGRHLHIKVVVGGPFQSKELRHNNSCWMPLWKQGTYTLKLLLGVKELTHYNWCWRPLWKQGILHYSCCWGPFESKVLTHHSFF